MASPNFASIIGSASLVIKATGCTIKSLRVRNRSASIVYAMLFNSNYVPVDGTVTPVLPPFLIPANTDTLFGTDHFTDDGMFLSAGASVAVSTTDSTTKTIATTATNHDISAAFL